MAHYLEQHPQIAMPAPKEIHCFGKDLRFTFPRITTEEYLSLFRGAPAHKRIGEASVWYLYSAEAAAEIKEFNPSARIIIMLRNPVDMMYSLYWQRRYNGNEDLEDFASALDAEPDRRRGRRIPSNVSNLMGLYYRDSARFTEQLRRYIRVFGRENIRIIIFDDLRFDMPNIYRETCKFLDVSASWEPDFRVINQAKQPRSTRVRDFLRDPPRGARGILRTLRLTSTRRGGFKGWLRRLNEVHGNIPPMERELRKALQREFMPEVQSLSELVGRDLTDWCKTASDRPESRPPSYSQAVRKLLWILSNCGLLLDSTAPPFTE
jgi:hypothetical protein